MVHSRQAQFPLLVLVMTCLSTAVFQARASEPYQLRLPLDGTPRWQQVQLKLEVTGQVLMRDGQGKENRQQVSVEGHHAYEEGVIFGGLGQSQEQTVSSVRAVRLYQPPRVVMMVGQTRLVPRLRANRRTVLMSSRDGKISMTALSGALTREELDLIRIQGDSALLPLMLPIEPVEVDDSWSLPRQLVTALLNLDRVDRSTVQGTLSSVKESIATVTLAGTVQGTVEAVAATITLRGTIHVNLRSHRIDRVELKIEEKRAIGRAQPGLDVSARLSASFRPLAGPFQVSPDMLAEAAGRPVAGDELLEFQPRQSDYRLLHDPHWYVTSDRSSLALLRFIDEGKVLAQCTISRLPSASRLPASLEQFQRDVHSSLGDSFRQFVEASEELTTNKLQVMRVVAEGVSQELSVVWIYYHVQDPEGRRVAVSFSVPATLVADFATADRSLIATLTFDSQRTRQLEGTPVGAGSSNSSKPSQSVPR